jgi:enoyl-CoA hydratase/carnithine racemase
MTSESPAVHAEKHGPVLWLTLSYPPANCYSYELMRHLDERILDARMDDSVHVIVLSGAGEKFFCAGADIGMLQSVTPQFKYQFCLHANETLLRLENTNKLVIAALNGHCVGGGFEVAMACDLRVARAGRAKVGLPEVNLGVLPGTGGTARLSRLVGKSKALELMVEGTNLGVDDARSAGLVNKVIEADSDQAFRDAVLDYARGFCPPARASMSVGHIKRSVQAGAEMSLEGHLALERELQQRLFESEDAAEGLRAYNEKRDPEFAGR